MRLANRFGRINQIRRDRPLTREELMQHVPSVFGEDKHAFRSEKYTFIPTITLLENLQREGFQPVTASQILTLRRMKTVRTICGQFLIVARKTC